MRVEGALPFDMECPAGVDRGSIGACEQVAELGHDVFLQRGEVVALSLNFVICHTIFDSTNRQLECLEPQGGNPDFSGMRSMMG